MVGVALPFGTFFGCVSHSSSIYLPFSTCLYMTRGLIHGAIRTSVCKHYAIYSLKTWGWVAGHWEVLVLKFNPSIKFWTPHHLHKIWQALSCDLCKVIQHQIPFASNSPLHHSSPNIQLPQFFDLGICYIPNCMIQKIVKVALTLFSQNLILRIIIIIFFINDYLIIIFLNG